MASDHLEKYQFTKGQPKTSGSGRRTGARNKLSLAFLDAFAADFEAYGIEVIKIVRMERPHEYLKVAAFLMPKAYDDEHPAVMHIVTGVPRTGEDYPDSPPQIPARQSLADLNGDRALSAATPAITDDHDD